MSIVSRKISKYLTYLLRHEPSGLRMDDNGFVEIDELVGKLRDRWPDFSLGRLEEIVEEDPKGRYQIEGDKIRALYGHSIEEVDIKLPAVEPDLLYHGTTDSAAEKILKEGLKSKGRNKVHLSPTPKEARKVGKRRTKKPKILKIRASEAVENGQKFWKAGKSVYLSEYIPPEFIGKYS